MEAGHSEGNSSTPGSSSSQEVGNRRRIRTEGSSSNALRFLERPHRSPQSSDSCSNLTSTSPWPLGFVPQATPSADRPRVSTLQPHRLPRNSPLAFLERLPTSLSATSLVAAAGADAGLGSLSGEVAGAGSGRGGFIPYPREALDESGSEGCLFDSDDEEDSNVCPSMLFSCFPCLKCLRRRRPTEGALVDSSNIAKSRSRSQTSLTTPLLEPDSTPPSDFPKDVKLIEVEVESARNVPSTGTASMEDSAGTYVSLRMAPVQEGVGEQMEQTSLATRAVNPRWGGRETFTFFVTDTGNAKAFLALHLLYRPLRPPPPPSPGRGLVVEGNGGPLPPRSQTGDVVIGEGFVDLLSLFPVNGTYTPGGLKGNSRRVAVPMREPLDKRRTKCSVMLGLRCRRVNETIDTREDRLFEYQSWTQVAGWSSTGPPNARKWSTLDGGTFSDAFTQVAPPPREESEVVLPWCPFGGWEYCRDAGWDSIVNSPKGAVWMEGYVSGPQAVRRRLWRRVFHDQGLAPATAMLMLERG